MLLSETAALDGRWFHILPVRGSLKLFFKWPCKRSVCQRAPFVPYPPLVEARQKSEKRWPDGLMCLDKVVLGQKGGGVLAFSQLQPQVYPHLEKPPK